jgi:hypothetical protein
LSFPEEICFSPRAAPPSIAFVIPNLILLTADKLIAVDFG